MPVFIEQCSLGMCSSWNKHLEMAWRVVSQEWGFNTLIWTGVFHWFPVSPNYSHLCTVSLSVYDGYLLSTYSCGIRILLALQTSLLWEWSVASPPRGWVYHPCVQRSDIFSLEIASVGMHSCAVYISRNYYSRVSSNWHNDDPKS